MRQKLEKNIQLNLKNKNLQKSFIIDSFVGEGASCLVYNAKYIDELGIIRNVRIKELYPIECCETREEDHIIWPSDEKKNYYVTQFENLYQRQIYFQNVVNFTNSSTQIIDNIYEANNTKYIILDCANGKTFDKVQPNHLQNIFEVILSLTKLVKKYHDQGYLMLDIKPENFLTIDETNQLIKYLDFDSILSLYIIKNNHVNGLSCSLRYAAPEVIRGDIKKIDKCSDIYSIGAILYKKIYNQDVTSNERSIGFTPNYDNKYFTNINPKIYKKLTSFFRKTLCNHSKRRYQDCEEMIIDLEELIEISNPNSCVLISSSIIQNNYFVGRDNECEEIDQVLNDGKKIVFINGYGGIGKTELVKYYANSRSKNYHTIILGKCTNGLKEVFENEDVFMIKNLRKDEVSLEERIKIIKQLVDEETLIVIDNLDILNDPYFEILCSFNCKLLITTRTNLEGIISNTDTIGIITVGTLMLEDAYALFTQYYQRNIVEEEKQAIYELIKHIEGFTLMIPILAKQMMLESIIPSKMLNKLKNNKLKGISSSLVKHYKDNNIMNATAYDQALGLFEIFELTKEEKEVLYIMSLLGNISISKRTLALFAGQFELHLFNSNNIKNDFISEINKLKETTYVRTINSLIDKGYLDYDSTYDLVRCHNIIREISLYEFNYSLLDTTIFNQLFEIMIDKLRMDYLERQKTEIRFTNYVEHHCLDSVYENELKQLCFNVFDNVDFSNNKNQKLIFKYLLKMIIVSEKDYTNIINKYLNETNQMILYICDWIQSLCLNLSSEILIEKMNFITSFKSKDLLLYLENMSLFFDEILMYPYIWLLDVQILSALKDQLLIYEEKSIDVCDIQDFKSYRKLYDQIDYAIKHNAHDDVIFDGIHSIRFKLDENQTEENTPITFKNIISISDHHYDKYEHKRSLHEISDNCYKDIKNFEYKATKDDIEIPILLSILDRYRVCEDIERDQFVTYFRSFSALDQINENIYEYLARKNDYMFMSLQLKQYNILKNINEISNVQEYLLHSYRLNTSVGKLLATEGEPSVLIETLRIYIENILTKENLEHDTNNMMNFFGKTTNYSVNEFYNYCIEIGKKVHDSKLLQLIEKSKREIIGLDISYHDPELSVRNSLDCEAIWNRIEELYRQCIQVKDLDEISHLRDEIMVDTLVPTFFKTKLLNCINPKISFFDSLLIDEKYVCKKYTCDIDLLNELLEKERNHTFEGIEEIINLFELCLQYNILNNKSKAFEYTSKIEKYIDKNIVLNNKFNYILYKIYHAYINVLDTLGFDLCCKSLVLNLYINCFETEKYRNHHAYDPTYYVDFKNLLNLYDKYNEEIDLQQEKSIDISKKIDGMFDEIFKIMDEKED